MVQIFLCPCHCIYPGGQQPAVASSQGAVGIIICHDAPIKHGGLPMSPGSHLLLFLELSILFKILHWISISRLKLIFQKKGLVLHHRDEEESGVGSSCSNTDSHCLRHGAHSVTRSFGPSPLLQPAG